MPGIDTDVAGIGALAEPVRRELYRYVCSQPEPVSRDQAAQAVQIARHQAKFHLDRLEAAGLLEADYVRLTGRTGPGAGRPAKRYRRGGTEFAISVPPRDYELAGHIMAEAIAESAGTGAPIQDTLVAAAEAQGAAIAATSAQRPQSTDNALDLTADLLSRNGYEPRRTGSTIVLANCPFRALARSHTELVCQMNHSLIRGLCRSVAADLLDIRLQPQDNHCCVRLTRRLE